MTTPVPGKGPERRSRRRRHALAVGLLVAGGLPAASAETPAAGTMLFATDLPFHAYAARHFPDHAEAGAAATAACNRNTFKPAWGWRYWARFADGPARIGFGHIGASLIDLEGIRTPNLLYMFQEVLPPNCAVIAVDNQQGD